ncbi:MAG: tRNA (N6-threonylcarbamoyladenosine(37)-N6)-methyltransferase TrmO [Rhizobiaceae bacterium]|nr:MAG: tRNA (N6-threonylcarbamoyladenosine(37)-N6)-methyltransferase TrmO [Rhizobiaceae bacterium]
MDFTFSAIGVVHTPFREKFGIPRQPGLVSAAKGVIKVLDKPDLKTALRSLEEFSHLWIVFVFHEHGGKSWKPSIRPPRLGGSKKVGVLASRSPHRPNPIGLSAVSIERIDLEATGGPEIHVSGVDLLDGTPVLDLKPYIPYADSLPAANAGWASEPIERVTLAYTPEARTTLRKLARPDLEAMITEVLELDHEETEGSILNQGDFLYYIPWGNVGFWYTTDPSTHAEDSLVLGNFEASLDELEYLEGRDVTVEAVP